jgi:glycosyltransferase involved in cell wall biosynthesis
MPRPTKLYPAIVRICIRTFPKATAPAASWHLLDLTDVADSLPNTNVKGETDVKTLERDQPTLITVVVPIYKEEENVRSLIERLGDVFGKIGCRWEVLFAMDPSPDRTREKILELRNEGHPVRMIAFSRRIGKPLSVLAGLDHTRGDASVIIDADLQDPPELIEEMVNRWREGFDVVIAQRASRKGESFIYLKCAEFYYWMLEKIAEVKVPRNTGDYRLLDHRVVKEICRFRERHAFLRGLTAAAGFRTIVVPFDRDPRLGGKSRIPFGTMVNIALDGVVPFSRAPLRLMLFTGIGTILAAGAAALAWLLYRILGGFPDWWQVELLCLLVVGATGLIVGCMGVLGEYLVRAYEEARERPLYIIDEAFDVPTQAYQAHGREGLEKGIVES